MVKKAMAAFAITAIAAVGWQGPSAQANPANSARALAPRAYTTGVLIYDGSGTSDSDAQSIVGIVQGKGLSYKVATETDLNAMSVDDLAGYGALVFPGGEALEMTEPLTEQTRQNIQSAVRDRGVSYVGFCAGAWMAVGNSIPMPTGEDDLGFALIPGAELDEYLPDGQDPTAAMVMTTFADGSQRDLVWWGGPIVPNIPGGVISKYPDGSPEMAETRVGSGFVVVSGTHPEAPQSWRDAEGLVDSDGLDLDIAWNLINAGLTRTPLPTFAAGASAKGGLGKKPMFSAMRPLP